MDNEVCILFSLLVVRGCAQTQGLLLRNQSHTYRRIIQINRQVSDGDHHFWYLSGSGYLEDVFQPGVGVGEGGKGADGWSRSRRVEETAAVLRSLNWRAWRWYPVEKAKRASSPVGCGEARGPSLPILLLRPPWDEATTQ